MLAVQTAAASSAPQKAKAAAEPPREAGPSGAHRAEADAETSPATASTSSREPGAAAEPLPPAGTTAGADPLSTADEESVDEYSSAASAQSQGIHYRIQPNSLWQNVAIRAGCQAHCNLL